MSRPPRKMQPQEIEQIDTINTLLAETETILREAADRIEALRAAGVPIRRIQQMTGVSRRIAAGGPDSPLHLHLEQLGF